MLTIRTKGAGPSAPRWVRLNETEVGRPHFRLKKNPVAASSSQSSTVFPYAPELQTLELVRWALFDVAEAVYNIQLKPFMLFVTGQGQPTTPQGNATAYNKTALTTNLATQNGVLPNPQSLLVSTIRQAVRGDLSPGDLMNLSFSTLATLQCGDLQRIYFQELLGNIPGAATGVYVGAINATTYTGNIVAPGWPTAHNVYSLQTGLTDPNTGGPDLGVIINQGRSFQVILDPTQNPALFTGGWTTRNTGATAGLGGNGFQLWIYLDGVLARSLQG